jgi:hypothetical protein
MDIFLALLMQGRPEAAPLNPIARYEWVFPWVESAHICGLCLLVGIALVLNMRLMGVMFKGSAVSKVANQLSPWIRIGLLVMLTTGPYLFSSDAGEYIQVPAFRVKMALLLIAILFHFLVIRPATDPGRDSQPLGWRKVAGGLSMSLWLSVVIAGLWIGNL